MYVIVPKAQASYNETSSCSCIQEMTVYIIHKYIYIYKESILYTQLTAVLIFNVMFRDFVKGQLLYFCVFCLFYFERKISLFPSLASCDWMQSISL